MIEVRGPLLAVLLLASGQAGALPFAYTVNSDDEVNADQLLRIDLATGAFEFIGPLPNQLGDVEGLAFDPEGVLYAVDNATKTLVQIDTADARTQNVGNRSPNLGFQPSQVLDLGLTFACDGQLLMVAEQTQSLYEVSVETGQALVLGESGGMGDAMTALASFGASVYGLAAESNRLYRIDRSSGVAHLVATLDGPAISDAGMAFDEDGRLWAVIDGSGFDGGGNPVFNASRIIRIDVGTGAVEEVATTRTGLESLAIAPPGSCTLGTPGFAIPTLSRSGLAGLILMLAALGAIGLRRPRQRS